MHNKPDAVTRQLINTIFPVPNFFCNLPLKRLDIAEHIDTIMTNIPATSINYINSHTQPYYTKSPSGV